MIKIAIHGHPTRGKEVIQILESLGGKNKIGLNGSSATLYYIDKGEIRNTYYLTTDYKIYTLEEVVRSCCNIERYDSKSCQRLKEKIANEDSIKERHKLINRYLGQRIALVESVIAKEFPDDVSYKEMIECLLEDLKMVQTQIKLTYDKVL